MPKNIKIDIKILPHAKGLELPKYATVQSAGADLVAAIDAEMVLKPGERKLVETGLAIGLPVYFEAQIRPRSGLALKNGITVLNSPGTIDADYRGEVKILLANLGDADFTIKRGDRIAQMIIAPVTQGEWNVVEELDDTERGGGGFGSTGVKSDAA